MKKTLEKTPVYSIHHLYKNISTGALFGLKALQDKHFLFSGPIKASCTFSQKFYLWHRVCLSYNRNFKKMIMKKMTLFFGLMIGALVTYAQTANLVIFSDEGSKFFVVVNGLRVNDQAQSNVRVTGLNADYVNTKIVFENELIPDIEKKTLMLARGNEATYVIKKNKKGEVVCNYYSEVPLNQAPVNSSNQQTVVYTNVPPNNGVVIRTGNGTTTTTTTTTTGVTDVNANMNVGGVGMNVTIYDSNGGVVNGSTTSTTTTSYSSTSTTGNTNYNNGTTTTYNNNCIYGMSDSDFRTAKSSISSSTFEDSQMSTFKQVVSSKCVITSQVKEMLQLFTFEETKLAMAKYAYTYVADPSNYYSINDIFTFDNSKTELSNYVMSNKR
jgi:hypothetical protein